MLSLLRAWVQSLVRELRSHNLVAKKIKKYNLINSEIYDHHHYHNHGTDQFLPSQKSSSFRIIFLSTPIYG